LTKSC